MTFKQERFQNFREVIRYNFEALNRLANIRLSLEDKRVDTECTFLETVHYIEGMAYQYSRVAELSQDDENAVNQKLAEVKCKGRKPVINLNYAKKFGYQGTSLMKENSEELFNAVENISKPMQDPTKPDFKLQNVNTLHDCIRYLHQKTIDAMFDIKDANGNVLNQNIQGAEIKVVDLDNNSQNNKCLSEIVEEYTRISPFKPGHETIKLISIGDYINAHLRLGCHSADLSALIDGSAGFIDLNYKESGCGGSQLRQQYILECLEDVGFKVNIKNGLLEAKLRDKSEATVKKLIKYVTRLLASSKDLDICGNLQDQSDVSFAVQYFTAGGINTQRAMSVRRCLKTTLEENRELNEAIRYLEHRVKTKINKTSSEEQKFLKAFLVEEFAKKYSSSEELTQVLEAKELLTEKPEDLVESSFSNGIFSKFKNDLYMNDKFTYIKNDLQMNDKFTNINKNIFYSKNKKIFDKCSPSSISILDKEYKELLEKYSDLIIEKPKPFFIMGDGQNDFEGFKDHGDYKSIPPYPKNNSYGNIDKEEPKPFIIPDKEPETESEEEIPPTSYIKNMFDVWNKLKKKFKGKDEKDKK